MSRNTNRLFRLVNQLLDFQKLSQLPTSIKTQKIEISDFLVSIMDQFRPACINKGVSFKSDYNDEKLYVKGEIDAIEKILFNYLSNALKFTDPGGEISVSLTQNPQFIRISVTDTGPGISERDQERLFEVFTQIDDTSTREHEGTGLGLALVKKLARAMSGEVGVESKVGKGSTFWVDLLTPKRQGKILDTKSYQPKKWLVSDTENASIKQESIEADLPGNQELILVVDDLADMRKLIGKMLNKKKYER